MDILIIRYLKIFILIILKIKHIRSLFFKRRKNSNIVNYLWPRNEFKLPVCPNKHGNSVTRIRYCLCYEFAFDFKSHNIVMYARVCLMKKGKDCKDVFIMCPQDEQ